MVVPVSVIRTLVAAAAAAALTLGSAPVQAAPAVPSPAVVSPEVMPTAAASKAGAVALRPPLAKVLARVNAARAKHDAKPLRVHRCLTVKVAQPWAVHLSKIHDLVHRDLNKVFDMCPGFSRLGENIAYGYPSAAAVMRGWMHSPGHRENILNKSYTRIGLGLARTSDGTRYWVQNFGG
ncbi:MAG: CAP domain-containing protein [Nocardioidaceae bacterium]